jgi:hypothetical protein
MSNPADGGRRRIPESRRMTYILSTNGPGDEATFRKVGDLVGDQTEGLIALYAGTSGAGLSVTAIWESKAHADRFTAEKLMPALRQVGVEPGTPTSMIEFETFAAVVAERTRS